MTNVNIQSANQSLSPGDRISLFTLDLSPIGVSEVWTFTPNQTTTGPVTYRGIQYYPADVQVEGFEYNGQGQLPQPKIRVSNATLWLAGTSMANDDLVGATFTRLRTYRQFLDDGVSPDPEACFEPDTFQIEQKSAQNPSYIEWTLSARMDQQGVMLPRRLVYRDACLYRYRRWVANTSQFDYSKVTECPYTGANSFDYNNNQTTSNHDRCAKTLKACKLRFGQDAVLPFGGFPGVNRARQTQS